MKKSILITGGAGFIGSHLLRLLVNKYPETNFVNFDSLTYAADLKRIDDISNKPNYNFVHGDIRVLSSLRTLFEKYNFDSIIHLAAESHVDQSITNPFSFAQTNVIGTINLLEIAREFWNTNFEDKLFYHISTDEVYGTLEDEGSFKESDTYKPRSPYSASKASSDHFVNSYFHTYGLPIIISNCSNNFGPDQDYEKLIPLVIKKIVKKESIPIYGEGKNIRDWLYVGDHVRAIELIFRNGRIGQNYNIGGQNEIRNIDLVNQIIKICDKLLDRPENSSLKFIKFVQDRKGHDYRYSVDFSKLKNELDWNPMKNFNEGLNETVKSYIDKLKTIKK